MFEYGFTEKPEFEETLSRLAALRRHEFLLRVMNWLWAGAIIGWLLPFGEWSAVNLKPASAMVTGLALVTVQLVLLMRYRAVTRRDVFEPRHGTRTGDPAQLTFSGARRGGAGRRFGRAPRR
jgi:hypothetical protein